MRIRKIAGPTVFCAIVALSQATASAMPLKPSVFTDLATIKRSSDDIASGRFAGSAVRIPAREIALAWGRIEPALFEDGDVLVETKMANRSIAILESKWQSKANIRDEARAVSGNVADLISAAKT